jgi:uncharacterized membrane protein
MLNHVPLFGGVVSLLLLLVAIWRRSDELKRVAFGMLVLSALITLPVYFTGEPAEEAVEHLPGVVGSAVDLHQDAAKIAFASMLATGAVALISFALLGRGRIAPNWLTMGPLVMSLLTVLLMARTANLGGKVRHTELGAGTATTVNAQEKEEHEHEKD